MAEAGATLLFEFSSWELAPTVRSLSQHQSMPQNRVKTALWTVLPPQSLLRTVFISLLLIGLVAKYAMLMTTQLTNRLDSREHCIPRIYSQQDYSTQ